MRRRAGLFHCSHRRSFRDALKRREISLCPSRPLRRSKAGRRSRPAPFEMTVWRGGGESDRREHSIRRSAPVEIAEM